MTEDNIAHLKFKGRTYGRPRICQSSQVFDEVVSEAASVTLEGCESLWTSCFSECNSFSSASALKKGRIDGSESDFSFDGDKSKAKAIKMQHQLQGHKLHTRKSERINMESNFRCSRNKKVTAAFCESGMKAPPEQTACLFEESLAETHVNWRDNDDLSFNHKPQTVKSFLTGVIPDEKPNSPILMKYRRRKRNVKGRPNLTLIENYNSNSTKFLTRKSSPSMHKAYESAVIPQHKLACENLDTTVSVCKQASQLAEDTRQAKYFLRKSKYQVILNEVASGTSQEDLSTNTSRDSVHSTTSIAEKVASRTGAQFQDVMRDSSERMSTQEIVSTHSSNDSLCSSTDVTDEIPSQTGTQPQNILFMGDNLSEIVLTQEIILPDNSSDSFCSSTTISKEITAQTGTQPHNFLFMGDNSQHLLSPPVSNCSNTVSPTSVKCITETDNFNVCSVKSATLSQTSSHDDKCFKSQRPVRKQYRIFKSRSAQIEEKLEAPIFDEHDDSPLPSRQLGINASGDSQVTPERDKLVSSPPSCISAQASNSAGPTPTAKCALKTMNYQHIDVSPVAELHASPDSCEKGTDFEFMSVLGNVPFSEPSSSQETLSNSQNSLEGDSQNSLEGDSQKSSPAVTVWKFFKSKKSLTQSLDLQKRNFVGSPQKLSGKASYNIRSWNSEHNDDTEKKKATIRKKTKNKETDIVVLQKPEEGPRLKREMHWPVGVHDEAYTTLTVSKRHKELYTVIQNVRQTHEVQELGETHDFIKEIDYLLDSLNETNSNSIRCLSCLQLANKCISPAFRMHMRVHGTVSRIFNLLEDACSDPSLALSTSAIMFVLSRDRLSMDLDHHSLNLMLKLNENEAGDGAALDATTVPGLEKTRKKVKELLGLLQETYSREVDLDFVSTSSLALESLLSLTSRRAGEWFKEELRSVGGLDHIVDSVRFCERNLPENLSGNIQKSLPVLRKLNRCLRVLENISYMNSENQNYLLLYRNFVLLQSCSRTLRLCQLCMPAFKLPDNLDSNKADKDLPGHTIMSCVLIALRVMINITHGIRQASLEEVSLMETVVKCLTTTLWCVPADQRFDLAVQCLVLLTNLVEHQEENRQIFINMRIPIRHTKPSVSRTRTVSAVSAVVELFVQREQAAREMEEEIGGISDSAASPSPSLSGKQKEAITNVQQAPNKQNAVKKKQKKSEILVCTVPTGESAGEHPENQSILEDSEETFTTDNLEQLSALHKAGKHMENSIVAAYAAILLGSIIADNKENLSVVKKLLPKGDFGPMVSVLTKFLRFMVLVTTYDHCDVRLIERVIEVLTSA